MKRWVHTTVETNNLSQKTSVYVQCSCKRLQLSTDNLRLINAATCSAFSTVPSRSVECCISHLEPLIVQFGWDFVDTNFVLLQLVSKWTSSPKAEYTCLCGFSKRDVASCSPSCHSCRKRRDSGSIKSSPLAYLETNKFAPTRKEAWKRRIGTNKNGGNHSWVAWALRRHSRHAFQSAVCGFAFCL